MNQHQQSFGVSRVRAACRFAVPLLAVLASAGQAHAVGRSWIQLAGGNAGTSGNWNPAGSPAPIDALVFEGAALGYTVTWGASVQASAYQRYSRGNVTCNFTFPHTVESLDVTGIDTNALIIGIGRLTTSDAEIGATLGGPNETSTLFIAGNQSEFICNGPLVLHDWGSMLVGGSAEVQVTGDVSVGDLLGEAGENSIFVEDAIFTQTGGSALGGIKIGGQSSTDSFEIGQGGTGTVTRLNIALYDQSDGAARVGVDEGADGLLTVTANIQIGPYFAGNEPPITELTAELDVGPRGTLVVNGSMEYDHETFVPTGEASFGGTVNTGPMRLKAYPVSIYGGTTTVTANGASGPDVIDTNAITVNRDGSGVRPLLVVQGGGDFRVDQLVVGDTGRGRLELRDGNYTAIGSEIIVGKTLGSDGELLIANDTNVDVGNQSTITIADDGNATATLNGQLRGSTGTLHVGRGFGDGVLSGNGSIAMRDINLGFEAALGGSGTINLSSGQTLLAARRLNIGNALTGDGLVTGTNVTVGMSGTPANYECNVYRRGILRLTDSSFEFPFGLPTPGVMRLEGNLDLTNVQFLNTGITMVNNPLADLPKINGSAVIDGEVITSSDGVISIANGGTLDIGRQTGNVPFVNRGLMRCTAGSTLIIRGASTNNSLGTIELQNGTLDTVAWRLRNDGSISGNGRVEKELDNWGTITLTDFSAISGLRFKDDVYQEAPGLMTGTRAWFDETSSFTGSGSILAKVQTGPGVLFSATGSLTLGDSTRSDAIEFSGEMRTNGHEIELRDFDGVTFPSGSIANLRNGPNTGVLRVNSGLNIETGAQLWGDGTVRGNVVMRGTVMPEIDLRIQGNYT